MRSMAHARSRRAAPRAGILSATAAALTVLALGSCAPSETEPAGPSGFTAASGQLVVSPTAISGHPDPARWEVEVAWVDPEVAQVTVFPERPDDPPADDPPADDPARVAPQSHREAPGADRARSPGRADATVAEDAPGPDLTLTPRPQPGAEYLTPIPSPALSWGSAQVEDAWLFQNPTLIGSPLAFLVVEDRGDWLRVQFPARPNQQTGWIDASLVTVTAHRWHAEVNVTTNRLRVWDGDDLVTDTGVVAGTSYTPTPLGRFYFNEKQQTDPWSAYGSWILSTNGFSDTLERFGGEVPIFALHGTPYPETVGQDLSNGCIRMPNEVVEYLAEHMPIGTPIDVVA